IIIHTLVFSNLGIQEIAILYTYLIWYFFCLAKFENITNVQIIRFLVISFTLYNAYNYIWYEISYSHLQTGVNSTLKLFGITAYRVNFPMASSPTTNAAQ